MIFSCEDEKMKTKTIIPGDAFLCRQLLIYSHKIHRDFCLCFAFALLFEWIDSESLSFHQLQLLVLRRIRRPRQQWLLGIVGIPTRDRSLLVELKEEREKMLMNGSFYECKTNAMIMVLF